MNKQKLATGRVKKERRAMWHALRYCISIVLLLSPKVAPCAAALVSTGKVVIIAVAAFRIEVTCTHHLRLSLNNQNLYFGLYIDVFHYLVPLFVNRSTLIIVI